MSVQFILDEVATRCEEKVLGLAGTRQETLQDQCACELERKYSQTLPQELTLCLLRHCPLASYFFFFFSLSKLGFDDCGQIVIALRKIHSFACKFINTTLLHRSR